MSVVHGVYWDVNAQVAIDSPALHFAEVKRHGSVRKCLLVQILRVPPDVR
jgi:hypothetical protein